jgi:hypothetical protein
MKDNKLEVGDELYTGLEDMRYIGKIDRITKTMAFIGKQRFVIELHEGFTKQPGYSTSDSKHYRLVTEDIRPQIIRQQKRRKLELVLMNYFGTALYETTSRLTDSQLSRIIEILKEDSNVQKK